MARRPRVLYHVISRSNQRQTIYKGGEKGDANLFYVWKRCRMGSCSDTFWREGVSSLLLFVVKLVARPLSPPAPMVPYVADVLASLEIADRISQIADLRFKICRLKSGRA